MLGSLILDVAAVGMAWSLLGSPRERSVSVMHLSKTFTPLAVHSLVQSQWMYKTWIMTGGEGGGDMAAHAQCRPN